MMDFTDGLTLYDVLNIAPDATPSEIREAYMKTKATFQRDSAALYSLMDNDEGAEVLTKIEKAYEVLSSPEKRRAYDRNFGELSAQVISIDRKPPMEVTGDDLLISPPTDFAVSPALDAIPSAQGSVEAELRSPPLPEPVRMMPPPNPTPAAAAPPPVTPPPAAKTATTLEYEIETAIRGETEWSGAFLKRIREARRLTIEDMALSTRITKAYLLAIENENFAKLPAPVYIRGFVMQIARILKLPQQPAAVAYLSRFQKACPDKFRA
jgi:hypothetical protein